MGKRDFYSIASLHCKKLKTKENRFLGVNVAYLSLKLAELSPPFIKTPNELLSSNLYGRINKQQPNANGRFKRKIFNWKVLLGSDYNAKLYSVMQFTQH